MFFTNKNERLLQALLRRDFDLAGDLIAKGANPNAFTSEKLPMAAHIARSQDPFAMRFILEHGADPCPKSPDGGFALLYASANGSISCVLSLLEFKARVNDSDRTGLTPLMSAAFMGHVDLIGILIQAGADLEQKDQDGYTALIFASNAKRLAPVQKLIELGANVNASANDGSVPLMFAAQNGDLEIVEALCNAEADLTPVGKHGLTALAFAIQNKHGLVQRYLESKTP